MRYPTGHKEETRARIIRAAARRFRENGSDGTTIPDLMKDLRLTHGGFYRHFTSKESLFAAAFRDALQELAVRLDQAVEAVPPDGRLKALVHAYLSPEHCDNTGHGCPLAALISELARDGASRSAVRAAARAHFTHLSRHMPGTTPAERERKTALLFSGMAGTLAMARALPDGPERRRLLEDARAFYLRAASA